MSRLSLAEARRRYSLGERAKQLRSRRFIDYGRCWQFQFMAAALEQMRGERYAKFLRESPWL